MKPTRSVVKSFKKIIVTKNGEQKINKKIVMGETLIPNGSESAVIILPKVEDTAVYDVVNSAAMTGDINVTTTNGVLKGLVLNTSEGALSIDPVEAGARTITFGSTIKDGSFMNMLSDGDDWFLWSFGIGAGFGTSTAGVNGESVGVPENSTETPVTYAPVLVENVTITVDYPSGPAEHDLVFDGSAEPDATIKVFNSVPTQVATVVVDALGAWTWEVNDLANGQHEYTFEAFVGGLSINENGFWSKLLNGGAVEFVCPQIEVEVATAAPGFISLPTITDPLGATIVPTVNSTTYLDSMVEDATFVVVFDFVYDSVTYQRTISGVVVNLIQPAQPVISTVGGNASSVVINTTTVDIVGTALPGASVEVYIDGSTNTTIATVTADGIGEWIVSSHAFGFTQNRTLILKAQQQTVGGSRWSAASTDFTVIYEQNNLDVPTVEVAGFSSSDFTNATNPFTIQGTGVVGAEVTLNGATPITTPITVAGDLSWTTTANLTNDVTHTITAQATKAGFVASQQSNGFIINVDRTPPVLAGVLGTILYLDNVVDILPTATDAFSSVVVTAAYVPALTNAQGAYTATYTATDAAGNTAQNSRTITVTTQVIVPTNLVVTDNGNGTATITGTVTGTYADNLTVQIVVNGSNNGSPFDVTGGTFTAIITLADGTYQIQAKTVNTASDSSTLTTEETLVMAEVDVTAPIITVVDGDLAPLTHQQVVETTVNGGFTFTASTNDGSAVVVTGASYDNTSVGTYTIYFNSTDTAGNVADEVQITINVNALTFIEIGADKFGDAAYTNCTLSLDGDGDYATVSDGFRYTDFLSISLWFKTSNTASRRIISSHTAGIGHNGFFIGISNGTVFYRAPNMTGQQSNLGSGLANNVWHHLVLTWQPGSTNRKLYIDNSLIHSLSGNGTVNAYNAGQNLYIGAINHINTGPYEFFDGEIAKVEVLNEVLDATAVTTRYDEGVANCNPIITTSETFVRASQNSLDFGDDVDYDRNANEDFAVELDVKFSSFPAGANVYYDIVGKSANDFSSGWSILAYTASGVPSLRMFANTNATINGELGMNAPFDPTLNQWYTIKAVWKNTGVQELWIDGVIEATRTMAISYLPPVNSVFDLKVGSVYTNSNRFFDGEIRNLTIYKGLIE